MGLGVWRERGKRETKFSRKRAKKETERSMKISALFVSSVLGSSLDLDYFENTDVNFKSVLRRTRGQRGKGKSRGKNIPKQKYLRVGDNRDRVGDVLYFLLQNTPASQQLPTYDQLLMYGCWCQLHHDNWFVSNKGTPVDHIDNACRSWFKCYECLDMDDGRCDGIEEGYGQIVFHASSLSCENAGRIGSCKRNACECDLKLALSIFEYAIEFNPQYNSENDFEPEEECIASGGGPGYQPDSCCGTFPDRFPYYSYNGTRGCCHGKTFDSAELVCCDSGHAAISCDEWDL